LAPAGPSRNTTPHLDNYMSEKQEQADHQPLDQDPPPPESTTADAMVVLSLYGDALIGSGGVRKAAQILTPQFNILPGGGKFAIKKMRTRRFMEIQVPSSFFLVAN
jgi:hypothetical protein